MSASVSSAAALNRAGRDASWARSIASVYSEGIGRALANSAASSSFASGVTRDLHVGEWSGLLDAALSELRHLEQTEKGGEHLPGFGAALHEVRPHGAGADGEQRTDHADRARHVDRAGHDVVDGGVLRDAQDAIDRREQLAERE